MVRGLICRLDITAACQYLSGQVGRQVSTFTMDWFQAVHSLYLPLSRTTRSSHLNCFIKGFFAGICQAGHYLLLSHYVEITFHLLKGLWQALINYLKGSSQVSALYIRAEDDGSIHTLDGIACVPVKVKHQWYSAMTSTRKKMCMISGLTNGHTLIGCPYKCGFCGSSSKDCNCINSSLAAKVMDSETPERNKSTSK